MIGTKIEYEVDNFSGLILVDDFLQEIDTPKPHWTSKKKRVYVVPPYESGVYILYSEQVTPIYIGKSNNVRVRLSEHLRYENNKYRDVNSHEKCWHQAKQIESKYLAFILCPPGINKFLEHHLIQKYEPKYNRSYNNESLNKKKYDYTLFNDLYNPIREREEKELIERLKRVGI